LQEQAVRFGNGEMVYGNGFYELYLIVGKDFRRLLDVSYGNRLRRRELLGENFPQFFVDCRSVYSLSPNWLAKTLK
jgi:hypothetical protein